MLGRMPSIGRNAWKVSMLLAQLHLAAVHALSLPSLAPLQDAPAFMAVHDFSRQVNWLIPGYVMCGHYPGACPSREKSDEDVAQSMKSIQATGINTFVCLQDEVPPQDGIWPEKGVKKTSHRVKWATGNFKNYRKLAQPGASYAHYKLPDLSIAKSLNDLDEIVCYLQGRIKNGDKLYIHCWGGRGRTGLVAACLLGALYDEVDAEEALDRVQRAYSLREPWREKLSPETEEQKNQVREWFKYRRVTAASLSTPRPVAFGIWNRKGTDILEIVSPSDHHLDENLEIQRREIDADKLGSGRFGQVFRGRCEHTPDHNPVAIKVTYYIEDAPTHQQSKLALEGNVLRAMSGYKGFPEVLYDSRQSVFGKPSDTLVMQLLGRPILKRSWAKDQGDTMCKDRSFNTAAIMKIGRELLVCLRHLHEAGYMHNDLKPTNMLFGAQGSGMEDDVHLVDFGMVTRIGEKQDDFVEGVELQAGGASPMFASLAQLEGRPTRPVDDIESLWYCLAFLVAKELPWQWEPTERLTNIKRQLFIDECGIQSDQCYARLDAEDCCTTKHCLETYDEWSVPDQLHELFCYIIEGQGTEDGVVDYDGCLEAMREDVNDEVPVGGMCRNSPAIMLDV